MEDETKEYSELNLENTNDETINQTLDLKKEDLKTVNDQIKEIKKEEINNKIEEIKDEQQNNKNLNKALIALIIILSLLIISLVCYLLFFKNKKPTQNTPAITITRPSDDLEYTILKQNQISLQCNKTANNEKILSLKKGLIIECDLNINTTENISELYFDLNSSNNLKLSNFKNETEYKLENDKNTFLLKSSTPFYTLNNNIIFYYEVVDITEKTGYAEIKNIVFKDSKNNYYKMINSIIAFPPEYEDKVFIYKQTLDSEVSYIGSKTTLNDENLELIDTYKCSNEECEIKNNFKNNFIIIDNNKLLIYDVLLRTKQIVKIEENNFDYSKYEYEPISNKDGSIIGILFKKDYKDNTNCNLVDNHCIETSISGFDISYYSISKDMFTIALDYGFVGSNVFTAYDKVLLLYKNNKYGIFSYEEDNMMLELSKKYNSIEFDSNLDLVKLGTYDKKEYYYSYYNINNNSFIIDVKNKNVKSVKDLDVVYYIEDINRQGKTVYMLFNSKGEALNDIKYVLNLDIDIINNTLVIKNGDEDYDIYDLDGNYIETSEYVQSGLKVLKTTNNYLLALNNDNQMIVTDHIGKTIATIMPSNTINEIYEMETMNIEKFEESKNQVELIIKNPNIAEEGKNAYKFIVNSSSIVSEELITIEE